MLGRPEFFSTLQKSCPTWWWDLRHVSRVDITRLGWPFCLTKGQPDRGTRQIWRLSPNSYLVGCHSLRQRFTSPPCAYFPNIESTAEAKTKCTIPTYSGDENAIFFSYDLLRSPRVWQCMSLSLRWKMTEAFGVSPASSIVCLRSIGLWLGYGNLSSNAAVDGLGPFAGRPEHARISRKCVFNKLGWCPPSSSFSLMRWAIRCHRSSTVSCKVYGYGSLVQQLP